MKILLNKLSWFQKISWYKGPMVEIKNSDIEKRYMSVRKILQKVYRMIMCFIFDHLERIHSHYHKNNV